MVVAMEEVVVWVLLLELFEEKAVPYFELLGRGRMLELVDITLFVIDVEGVEVVAGEVWVLK